MGMQIPDHELWKRAAAGERAAFGVLFDRHSRAVYNHCFRLTASWSDAEDLTSTVFLQAWRRRGQLRTESVLPWLLTVATNCTRNEWRSQRRRRNLLGRIGAPEPVADHSEDVAGRVDDERRMSEVLTAVRKLPRSQAEAIYLCVWSGISYSEAATALGITESSVRARVRGAGPSSAPISNQ